MARGRCAVVRRVALIPRAKRARRFAFLWPRTLYQSSTLEPTGQDTTKGQQVKAAVDTRGQSWGVRRPQGRELNGGRGRWSKLCRASRPPSHLPCHSGCRDRRCNVDAGKTDNCPGCKGSLARVPLFFMPLRTAPRCVNGWKRAKGSQPQLGINESRRMESRAFCESDCAVAVGVATKQSRSGQVERLIEYEMRVRVSHRGSSPRMYACNRLNLERPLTCGPRGESLNEPALRQQRGEYNRGFTRGLRVAGVGNSTNVRGYCCALQ